MVGYYYCSLNTFLNIIRNKQIYLSDPLKMNDSSEITWYLDRLNDETIASDQELEESKSTFDMMKMRSCLNFTHEELMEVLNSKGQSSVYISCFSKEPDLLSQWRAYAEDGRGVSIGFNLEELGKPSNILIREVLYTNDVVYGDIESDVECVADEISVVISEEKITMKEEQIRVFLHELIPVLIRYKNPAFEEEREIRLIYCDDMKFETIVNNHNAFAEKWDPIPLKHDFRIIGSNNITEFVKLDFNSSIIEEICIGPKCLLRESDIENIVAKELHHTDVRIIKSKSTYR